MNNNEILEKNTVDIKETKEREKQQGFKAGYIACCAGMLLAFAVWVVSIIPAIHSNHPLFGTSAFMIGMGICFASNLSYAIIAKKASYIALTVITGLWFIGNLVEFINGIIGMI